MNASTFTARVITSTGADVAAAFSGCDQGDERAAALWRASRVLGMIEVEHRGDATSPRRGPRQGERLMGFGHRVYRAEDPQARVLRRTARELDAPPRSPIARAGGAGRVARAPVGPVLETNVEFWGQ